jgi:4-hydroxythreonine-4-phosphate dehydrogenase
VTGPIHKGRLGSRGFRFKGHTDFLGHLCGVDEPVMAFVGNSLRVVLVTVHIPLRTVAETVSEERVLRVLRIADRALAEQLGLERRRLLVCGVNPHAGERGDMGTEEEETIHPAVALARQEGIDARGPMSAEAAFHLTGKGDGEMVVAMYHDQGLLPLKAVHFGHSVNWTLGLPIVRTSVDHGTADDIVGKGIADPASFLAALALAERLTRP